MHNHNLKVQALKGAFDNLRGENRSAIRVVGELWSVATTMDRLECYADEAAKLHVSVDGREVFECTVDGGKSDFRNLLAVMFAFAKQFADHSLAPELSPYKINCIVSLAEFGGQNSFMRLETTNTASEQRFVLSKV